jgi:PIN domain nuclease of toxin-antitoxin system
VILLDTHALVWLDTGDNALGPMSRRATQQAYEERRLGVSAISFWECAMLYGRGRLELPVRPAEWRAQLLAWGLIEHPLDGNSAVVAAELEALRKDPADRFIAATAIVLDATLVTADDQLLRLRSKLKLQNARR